MPVRVKTIREEEVEEKPARPGVGDPFSYLAELSDEELARTRVRIYRRQPTNDGFIGQLSADPEDVPIQRITEKWISTTYGGGRYDLKIETKAGAEGYVGGIVIAGDPKTRPSANAPTASNGGGESALAAALAASMERQNQLLEKLIDRDGDDRRSNNAASASALQSTVEMMQTASNRAIDVVAAQMPKNGNSLLDTITVLKELGIVGGEKKDSVRETLGLLKELGIVAPKSEAKGLVEQLKDLTALKEFFANEGAGQGNAKTNWLDVLESAIEKSPQLLDRVMYMANENMRRKQAAAAGQQAAVQPSQPLPGATVEVQGAEPSAPAPPATRAANGDPDEPFKQRVLEHIRDGSDPIVVLQFIEGWNAQVAAMLHTFQPEQIRGFLAADPILKQALDLPHFEKWFGEFLEEIEQDNQDAEEQTARGPKKPN